MTPYAEAHAANVGLNYFDNNSSPAYTRHTAGATPPQGFRPVSRGMARHLRDVIHGELDNLDDVVATRYDVCLETRQHRRLLQGKSDPVMDGVHLLVRNPRKKVIEVWVRGWHPRQAHTRDYRRNLCAWTGAIPSTAEIFIRTGAWS
jgi:hypothetical protein